MRLWSLSPRYLDVKGLLAVWREGLLARAVLMGKTHGYLNHPQLTRFKDQPDPLAAINFFLEIIAEEGVKRGYHFDTKKVLYGLHPLLISVSEGQLRFEQSHLQKKLKQRDPSRLALFSQTEIADLHPLFTLVPGPIEPWEKV